MKKAKKIKIEQPYQVATRLIKAWDIKTWVKDEDVLQDIFSAVEEAYLQGKQNVMNQCDNVGVNISNLIL